MVLAMHVFWSTAEWARAIAALPCDGPLAERTVIVPRSRVAHQLRKELIRAGHTEALVGTRFATPIAAALDVLGVARAGEEALRPARIAALLRSGLDLHYFRPEVVARTPGWGDAFANTIGELEAAGLGPSDLPGADPRWRDLATLWHALDESAGASWTGARLLAAAARELEASERAWPFGGPTLVTVTDTPSVVWAQFARAVPNATLAMLAGRPLRVRWLERLQELFGSAVRAAVEAARPAALGAQPSEREVMSAFLFEPASVLTDPARPRSSGIDGSVTLEEHAGVEAELESSSDWVRRKVVAGVPLEEIAVLVARSHPVAALLADRLRESGVPVHFASGYPLASTAAGARVIAVLRAMRNHLALDWLAEVLPFLRLSDGEEDGPRHLGRSAAIEIATGLGTIGGHPATPIAAVEWSERIPLRIAALETELSTELEAPDPNASRGRRQQEQLLRNLRGIRPAVDALTGVTRALIEGAPLSRLTEGLCDLIEKWVLAPAEGAPLHAVLRGALAALASDSTCGSLSGNDALDCIEETMGGLGIPAERFGGPAVYVGTPRGAVGLRFESVRVIGLAEGSIPSAPREDPVIPASAKGAVCPWAMNEADVVLAQLHALDRVVRDATREVVLSFARTDFDGTQHEPSSVFIEAGAALARGGTTGAQAIPDVRTLSRLGFAPARQRAREERLALPLGRAAWLDRVASLEHHAHIPSGWREGRDAPVLDLARIHALGSGSEVGPSHGIFGQAGAFLSVPGLDANRPISASALDKLLGCPYRFVLERLLYWNEPDEASVSRSLDALTYGGLFHAVAERFFSEHGAAFGRREESLEHWQERASKIACEVFDHEMEWFPLPGDDVRATQVNRLRSNVQVLLDLDWNQAEARRFVDVERAFGYDDPLRLDCGLYVHGRIDRVDVEGRTTLVRDLKTGRGHPRAGDETEPCLARDVQIGLYSLVTERLAQRWGVPQKVAASYVYVDPATEPERAFRDDYADLRAATAEWLQVARGLLEERSFPKAATNRPCRYCVHQPVCRPSAERAAQVMKAAGGAARSLLDHHAGSREEEG